MKRFSLFIAAFTATLCVSTQAFALFEAKLTYGLLGSKSYFDSVYDGATTSLPSIVPTYGLGADAVVTLPLFPIGFGLRYENQGLTASSGGLEFKTDYTRTAIIINSRLIDTLLYLGPVFTYGMSHSGTAKASQSGYNTKFSSSSMSSYSIGLEAGAKLIGFNVGAEVGYMNFMWKNATDSTGTISGSRNIDLSGTYAKIMLGIGI